MRLIAIILAFGIFSIDEASAFCKNDDMYNQCSDLKKVSELLEQGIIEDYANYLAYPPLFHNEADAFKGANHKKEKAQLSKRFLEAAMEPARQDPLLAFYVGSTIRKGYWSLEGYGYRYNSDVYSMYHKQIRYFEQSLSMKSKWFRETAAKILGNIYYYGLLDPTDSSFGLKDYSIRINYSKAAEYYELCLETCKFNHISALLNSDPKKGLALLHALPGPPKSETSDDDLNKFLDATTKYRYLWMIYRFGMFGIERNPVEAKKYFSLWNEHIKYSSVREINLDTAEGLFLLYRFMKKDTIFSDLSQVPSMPTTAKAEIEVLQIALSKNYARAAVELYWKYSEGRGVSEDFLKAYAYLNLARGLSMGAGDDTDYDRWMDEQAREWQLTPQQIISAQQLSQQLMQEAIAISETKI